MDSIVQILIIIFALFSLLLVIVIRVLFSSP